jgi:hypothetical protein
MEAVTPAPPDSLPPTGELIAGEPSGRFPPGAVDSGRLPDPGASFPTTLI